MNRRNVEHMRSQAPALRQKWEIFDTRNGRRATMTTYPSREWARWQIQAWRELGVGNRLDLKKALIFLDARPAGSAGKGADK
jgi:hypothetical protein